MEEDVGVSGRANADARVGWCLHESSEKGVEAARGTTRGRREGGMVREQQKERGGFDGAVLYL